MERGGIWDSQGDWYGDEGYLDIIGSRSLNRHTNYGLDILSPSFFYFTACIISAISSISIGSSWTVAGTLGVALMGIATGLGLSPSVTAGAIISGAYFGDKMSPLSDTTNLAPAIAGTDLFNALINPIPATEGIGIKLIGSIIPAINIADIELFIDNLSVMYIAGMVVDYKKDIFGQRLMIDNPNVESMCGCGESFQFNPEG